MAEPSEEKVYLKEGFDFIAQINPFTKIAEKLPRDPKRLFALIFILVVIPLTVGIALRQQIFDFFASGPTPTSVKVMTYNIAGANTGNVYGDPTAMIDTLTTYIKNNRIDIVGLQEVVRFAGIHKKGGTKVDIYAEILQSLDAKGWHMEGKYAKRFDLAQIRVSGGGEMGNAILSRLPISNHVIYPLSELDNAHSVIVDGGGISFRVMNVHPSPLASGCPATTLNALVDVLNKPSDKMTLVMGDFNTSLTSSCMIGIQSIYHEVCSTSLVASGPDCLDTVNDTYYPGSNYKIDHIFLRNGTFVPFTGPWTVSEAHGDHSISVSDHYPIIATLSYSLAFAPPPPPPVNNPTGYHDGSSCSVSSGWTCDADNFNQPLDVHFYADGPAGSGTLIGSTTANVTREAGVGTACGGNSSHGFNFTTPDSLKDGRAHSIYAYAINIGSGNNNPLLRNSSKSITCAAPTTPPILRYDFEEGVGGSINDISGHGNTGVWVGTPSWTNGKVGKAISFNGLSNYVRVPDNGSLDGMAALTVSAWVYVEAAPIGGNYASVAKEAGGVSYRFITNGSGGGHFAISTTNTPWYTSGSVPAFARVSNRTWHYYVGTYDGSKTRAYTDGVLTGTSTISVSGTVSNSTGPLQFGAKTASNIVPFKGKVDQVRIYNYARTAAQIRQDYNSGN